MAFRLGARPGDLEPGLVEAVASAAPDQKESSRLQAKAIPALIKRMDRDGAGADPASGTKDRHGRADRAEF